MSRWWYVAALVPIVIGCAVCGLQVAAMIGNTADMPRVVVPGAGEVTLAAGRHTVYGETESVYRGVAYLASELSLRCRVTDPVGGAAIELSPPSGSATYTVGGFSGRSMFELVAPHAGTYQVACEGSGGPTTIAFGDGGVLAEILWLLASLGGGITVTSIAWLLVRHKRRRPPRPAPYFEVAR